MSQPAPDPNQQSSGWSKTKTGFSVVGKGASSARTGMNNGLSKLDNMSISSKGVSFKKNMSGGNILYDRDNHVSAPKMDVSHLPPPPKRIPGVLPPAGSAVAKRPSSTSSGITPGSASALRPGQTTSPRPTAPKPATSGRAVPPPPPSAPRPGVKPSSSQDTLPLYTPKPSTPAPVSASSGLMGDLNSRFGGLKTSTPAATNTKPASTIPSMNEASTALGSAKTMGGLYGKYGNQQPGQKTATPTWAEVKAGASAAQNLHSFHGKYAPKQSNDTAPVATQVAPAPQSIAAPLLRAPVPTPSPKPPLPRGKPTMAPPKEYCIGLYSFDAQSPGDLSFGVGDKIEVLERTGDPDAWWKGRLNGEEGIFPANYCKLELR